MGKTRINASQSVMICGGGHQGLSMAAHLSLNGLKVGLWNRTLSHVAEIKNTHRIACTGVVEGCAKIDSISCSIEDVVSEFIMVTTPSSAHKNIARLLAPYVDKNTVIILNPGRTFGAIDFAETLKQCGVKDLPHIAETQTIVYTCRRSGAASVNIFALKQDVKIASLQGDNLDYIMQRIPDCLYDYFVPVKSVALTSLSNVGMVLHCSPVLMNIGWIESEKVDFRYYYDGISPSIAHFLEKIDAERLMVAKKLGVEIESTADWLKRTYGAYGNGIYECIRTTEAYKEIDAPPTIQTRYILEDVPNGLVPVEYLGKELGVCTPNISNVVSLASSVFNKDFRTEGRCFSLDLLRKYI